MLSFMDRKLKSHGLIILQEAVLFHPCLASYLFWHDPAVHVHACTPARVYFITIQPKLHPLQDTTKSSLTFKAQTQEEL